MINPLREIRAAFPTALQFYCLPAQICFRFLWLLFLTIFHHRKGYFSIIIRYLKWCKVDYKSISPVGLSALSTFTALKIAKCILADSEACLNCQAFSTRALHSVYRKKESSCRIKTIRTTCAWSMEARWLCHLHATSPNQIHTTGNSLLISTGHQNRELKGT